MTLLHKLKKMADQANRSRSMVMDDDFKKQKTQAVEKLFDKGIFEKMDGGYIKCTTCSVRLQGGQGKKLTAQLFVHFVSDKHIQRLRIAVKDEGNVREEEPDVEDIQTVPDMEAEVPEADQDDQSMVLPDPLTLSVHQFLTDEEAEILMEAMSQPPPPDEDD